METVLTRASESIVFGLKSTKKSTKVVKKRWRICSGIGDRGFAFSAQSASSSLVSGKRENIQLAEYPAYYHLERNVFHKMRPSRIPVTVFVC